MLQMRSTLAQKKTEESTMRFGYGKFGIGAPTAAVAAILTLSIAGCGKTPAPEEPAKSAAPPAPIAAAKSQNAEPQRVDPAAAANAAQATAVKAALAADSRLKTFAIDVRAANGSVELFGTVDTKSSREKAGKIAAAVAGVQSVENHLVLVSGS